MDTVTVLRLKSKDFTSTQEDPREEEVATHSSILAWEILWTEESGRLQSSFSATYLLYDMGHVWFFIFLSSFSKMKKQLE